MEYKPNAYSLIICTHDFPTGENYMRVKKTAVKFGLFLNNDEYQGPIIILYFFEFTENFVYNIHIGLI